MESPNGFPESPLDQEEVFPCRGCGEILEECKAFELAGNRWHIECFKCNTCGDPLDSDANLLLLGDGTLICNKCTYSCNACNQKIEDLAILTGDQAFCANCFRCRNCKRKIENLRYARTSQGIFCMSCHESVMARKRKRSRQKQQAAANGSTHYEKSLPALPPKDAPPESYNGSRDMSSNAHRSIDRTERSPSNMYRDTSPTSHNDQRDNLILPASTYRPSVETQQDDEVEGPDEFFIPLAFDPTPAPGPSPHAQGRAYNEDTSAGAMEPQPSRDYFNSVRPSQQSHRDHLGDERGPPSRSPSADRDRPQKNSPHIAYQEKGRHPSDNLVDTLRRKKDVNMTTGASPSVAPDRSRPPNTAQHSASPSSGRSEPVPSDGFRLQEPPRTKRSDSRRNSKNDSWSSNQAPTNDTAARTKSSPVELPTNFNTQELPTSYNQTREDTVTNQQPQRSKREDGVSRSITARLSTDGRPSPSTPTPRAHERKTSTSSVRNSRDPTSAVQTNVGLNISSPIESPVSKSIHDMSIPPRAPSRPTHSGHIASKDSYTTPRAPPAPPGPPSSSHNANESVSSAQSDGSQAQGSSPAILRYSGGPEFSLEADVARIMGDAESNEKESSVLRRVSNAVSKHGRSFSDRGSSRASTGNKHRHGANGSVDIGSPTTASPDTKDELIELRNNLRRANQKIAELEADRMSWQDKMNSHADIKQANTELKEKRSTMAVLDTQREMIIRELEIITDRLAKAKDSNRPIDTSSLRSDIYGEFSRSLEKLKDNLGHQIESLMQNRQELTTEISNLIQMKDKGFQEYESLTSKNQQLIEMNNQLVQNIQGMYKANKVAQPKTSFESPRPNNADALGIYRMPAEEKSKQSMESRTMSTDTSGQNLLNDVDPDQTVISKPQIVDVKKAKANKFGNWKKGGGAAAKALGKNIKGAFASTNQQPTTRGDEPYQLISSPYNSTAPTDQFNGPAVPSPSTTKPGDPQRSGSGFGFFGGQQKGVVPGKPSQLKNATNNDSNPREDAVSPSTLFGSDLVQRCNYEKRIIPNIVIRCIQEVQMRGMDLEGIYRKSGSQSAVNAIRDGFNSNDDYDISDPDMDITAVTSVLKQYFRKLPNPLITVDIYDRFLAAGAIQEREKRIVEIRNVLNDLPKPHFECLQFLIFHLAQVTTKPETKMSALNLAVVFGPTIMRPDSIEREMTDTNHVKNSVIALIEGVKDIFGTEAA
ncbi:RhoGAP-domain-containing protein [Pseudovirgaria hyperparasitica]|uniref:RhoGAP-domain-containing protein n=1 Tax=Pseudovirgaria hyperparasitica TaxID=470096 RepID=A0A6A6WHJ4_9PEZI|nr:RhoGAP-domain-containing protein [Pseudovirgaria hyperparasitica]KAF2762273.1 RhoGAP-domain-containing protein [Pseudovirgaria hyperparasitica]